MNVVSRKLFLGVFGMVLAVLTAGLAQVAVRGDAIFPGIQAASAPARPAAPARARTVHAAAVPELVAYDWVITISWGPGGMLTCAGKTPAVSGYSLFLAAFAKCQKVAGTTAVVMFWSDSKDALGLSARAS